jgi:Tol biopolymer transport system component
VSGTKVFFNSLPAVSQGSGEVTVDNPAGLDAFTGSLQPYFYYSGALAPNETSAPQRWRFNVPLSAVSFSFTLYVSTQVVPAIVFEMAPSGNRDIYRMGIDGNDLVRLTTNGAKDSNPTVSQGKVVFVSYRDGNAELYSMPLRGGTETRLTNTAGAETSPALSPDGTKLAWTRADPGQLYKLWSGNASADSAKAVIGTSGDAIESTPSWASSTVLAYGSTMISSNDIFRVTVGGGAPTVLAASDQADVEPAWSPDGKQLAFASNRTRDTELYLLTVSTSTLTRLTNRTGSDGAPTWLSDGRIVYTCVQGTTLKLCILDPANTSAASIIPPPYAADHAAGVRF